MPAADVYRDVVASGGQIDVGFIPLWLGLVTATGILPPAYGVQEPAAGFKMLTDHLAGALGFTLPLALAALLGGEPAYDGPFYAERSPITAIDKVKVPTFLIGGEYDLFQRGTPLDFERIQRNGVPTKAHPRPVEPPPGLLRCRRRPGRLRLARRACRLRWFDQYLKGIDGKARPDRAADLLRAGLGEVGQEGQVDRRRPERAGVQGCPAPPPSAAPPAASSPVRPPRAPRPSRRSRSPGCAPAQPTSGPRACPPPCSAGCPASPTTGSTTSAG
ncbi:hypothetical protein [Nocardioides convexus]|uniref:hypothetical protein n=1 Tax=Nocardioides convexus TaxID=2712224 RepID=UPI0024186B0A|nr:hypothetical protein [Nocardioides convexus]